MNSPGDSIAGELICAFQMRSGVPLGDEGAPSDCPNKGSHGNIRNQLSNIIIMFRTTMVVNDGLPDDHLRAANNLGIGKGSCILNSASDYLVSASDLVS